MSVAAFSAARVSGKPAAPFIPFHAPPVLSVMVPVPFVGLAPILNVLLNVTVPLVAFETAVIRPTNPVAVAPAVR